MFTSVMYFALAGFGASLEAETPAWQTDYRQARQQAAAEQKPLVVVIGSGETGWQKLAREGFAANIKQLLNEQYRCVYINAATEEGQQLARAFEMSSGLGIIISDRSGVLQAFRHEGDLRNEALTAYLQRFADPQLVVQTTVTNPGDEHTSYYGGKSSHGSSCGTTGCATCAAPAACAPHAVCASCAPSGCDSCSSCSSCGKSRGRSKRCR